jgi:hypothetical protein
MVRCNRLRPCRIEGLHKVGSVLHIGCRSPSGSPIPAKAGARKGPSFSFNPWHRENSGRNAVLGFNATMALASVSQYTASSINGIGDQAFELGTDITTC